MKFFQAVSQAMRTVRNNSLRSGLTMLGIIIGVSSIILLVSISQGSADRVQNEMGRLGSDLLQVNVQGSKKPLSIDDASALAELPSVKQTAGVIQSQGTVSSGTNSRQVSVVGTERAYKEMKELDIQAGRFLGDLDDARSTRNLVLGASLAYELFSGLNPVGESVTLDGNTYTIVGVLEPRGGSWGENPDQTAYIPISTAAKQFRTSGLQQVLVQAESSDSVTATQSLVENELTRFFNGDSDAFQVMNQGQILETMKSIQGSMTLMLGGIAGISLLVGGIGIMNIMLVSVTERTREIGIRKAIGARRRDILLQFLVEAVTLCALGGGIGILLGVGGGELLRVMWGTDVSQNVGVMILSFFFSLVIGVTFGLFPAGKASKLDPIVALRQDG